MYSLNKITTTTDCDVLLTWAEKEKSDLLHKQYTVDRLTDNYSNTSVEIEPFYRALFRKINATITVVNGLQEGPAKTDMTRKITRLQYRRFVLENRKESYGSVALLEKEQDLERINKELDEVDVFITNVTAHKATL